MAGITMVVADMFLCRWYEVGRQVTSIGPEPDPPVWRLYDGLDRDSGKVRILNVSRILLAPLSTPSD